MADVALEGLSKQFGEVVAVDGVDLSIHSGEFFSLLGPSGCGKTTSLRVIAGLEAPSEGRVRIGGDDVTRRPAHRRDLAMVFQNYALFPHLNVAGNVAYGLKARGVPRGEHAGRVAEALAQVSLAGYEQRRVGELSGGQQQRVAVARAVAVRPPVLLLDEPLSNLDARLRVETRAMLRQVQRELGSTAVYVTHDQEEALALSDRLAVMYQGRVQQVGTPTEVYDHPANRFVATFIGRANLAPVVVSAPGRVKLPGGDELTIPTDAPVGHRGLLCVRPEALRLTEGSGLPATVRECTFGGAWYEYRLSLDGLDWTVVEPNLRHPGWSLGQRVGLELAGPAVTLLPEEA